MKRVCPTPAIWSVLLLLTLALAASLSAADRIAVMRGVVVERGVSDFSYAGNENELERVSLAGVTGKETREFNLANLREEVSLYEMAQRTRLGPRSTQPLHILLDPNESWAYARWGHPFRLRYPDGHVTTPGTGFIHLGEQFDYSNRSTAVTSDDVAANRELLAELDDAYQTRLATWSNKDFATHVLRHLRGCLKSLDVTNEPFDAYVARVKKWLEDLAPQLGAAGCPNDGFDAWVAEFKQANAPRKVTFSATIDSRYQFTLDGRQGGLEVYVQGMGHAQFRETVARLARDDLAGRGSPDGLTWDAFYAGSKSKDAMARLRRQAAMAGINEALTHEMAHMVHFEAMAGNTGNDVDSGNPIHRGSHTVATLSNPAFALAEGWAEAMAFSFGRQSPDAARRVATRIDYSDSVKPLREYLNGLFAGAVVARLRAQGKLGASETLAIDAPDPMGLDVTTFQAKVKEAAVAKGLSAAEVDRVGAEWRRDAALSKWFRRLEYVEDLQAHKGDKKMRHDFLSSEASVSIVLFDLRRDLGPATYLELTETMTRARPTSFAALLEAYAHARPERRLALYRSMVRSTDQILVTEEQLRLLEQDPTLELDLDRDGKVPGKNASKVRPDLFPAEPISFARLASLPPGSDPLAPSASGTPALPALSGIEPAEVQSTRPEGITRRVTNESVDFEGVEQR